MAVHMDCLHWVNRDSYLPQGSRGLKVGGGRWAVGQQRGSTWAQGTRAACTRACANTHFPTHKPPLPTRLPAPDGDQVQAGVRPGGGGP